MLSIAICDDEMKEIEKLEKIVSTCIKNIKLEYQILTFLSGEGLIESKEKFQIIFLDVSMTGINGIETGMIMKKKYNKAEIIYVTSYQKYWKPAINHIHAFAYLQKPIKEEEVTNQLVELIRLLGEELISLVEFHKIAQKLEDRTLAYRSKSFDISKIYYFNYLKKERKIILKLETEVYEYKGTMKEICEKMKNYPFELCDRGVLLNLEHIIQIRKCCVSLDNHETFSLSSKRSADFRKKMNQYIQKNM